MARFLLVALVVAALVGCGTNAVVATDSWPGSCPGEWRGDWQALANRTEAAVYCPRWLPWRFTGKITGNTVFSSVDPDGSYLVTFLDQTERHEAHMNMRGYPGRDSVPSCRTVDYLHGLTIEGQTPCFSGSRGTKTVAGRRVSIYTENRDADEHHLLYAWTYRGSLYTLSHHAHHSISPRGAEANLDRVLASLAVVEPRA